MFDLIYRNATAKSSRSDNKILDSEQKWRTVLFVNRIGAGSLLEFIQITKEERRKAHTLISRPCTYVAYRCLPMTLGE
jgi:hypothetical protein